MSLSATISNLENGKHQHIIVYGTSLTEGGAWVSGLKDILNRRFPGQVKLTNSAKAGQWSGWGLENLEERVTARSRRRYSGIRHKRLIFALSDECYEMR